MEGEMSKLLENKQMLHVAVEVVVILGIVYYFNQKTSGLLGHIEDLAKRIAEQDDVLQKHENIIRKLVDFVNSQPPVRKPKSALQQVPPPPTVQQHIRRKPAVQQKTHVEVLPEVVKQISFEDDDDDLEISDTELDDEIGQLIAVCSDDDSDLKKEL